MKAVFSLITLRCLIRARVRVAQRLQLHRQPGLLRAGLQEKSHNQADVENTERFRKRCFLL